MTSTARARDVWFSNCEQKTAVKAPTSARCVNLDGDGNRFLRKKGEKIDIIGMKSL